MSPRGAPPFRRLAGGDGRARSGLVAGALVVLLASLVSAGSLSVAPATATTTRVAAFPGGAHFRINCGFSHRSNDDPVVFPGQPGRSHNHTFLGNHAVDADTTPASLLGGRSSCDFEADSSGYWAPTLYVGRRAIRPLTSFVYYVKRTVTPIVALPVGLEMIAGNSMATRPQPIDVVSWGCGEIGARPRFAAVPGCARNHSVELGVTFPNCWNARSVDSADHKAHMAYSVAGRCPVTHPVAVPTVVLVILYPEVPVRAQVASGRLAAHADFMSGWDQTELESLVASLNAGS